ncbi:glycoside hydrolase 5 family protein [Cohnella fermenti]|uniref:1,4-beta-xylanase n=1 Tax=Cohnella fermenti TaxID=2565925 RepID=A0A4S4BYR2_9BACL|nr:hypothetical protein [Cohnella fermenti]THF80378.1 hypothetical protein E6C55_10885 [Cohnella fermenti]
MEVWTEERAWAWHRARPWTVGCNYIPSGCINLIEIWQEYGFERVAADMERELDLARSIGLNAVRMLLPFEVWRYQRDGFMERLERVLRMLDSRRMQLMPVFFDDCGRGPAENYDPLPSFGPQPEPQPGHHGGGPAAPCPNSRNPHYHYSDDRTNWPDMKRFVQDVAGAHRHDSRVLAWDIWNEPGNSGKDGRGNCSSSLEAMEAAFIWCREMEPSQPLTAGVWDFYHLDQENRRLGELTAIEKRAAELSDLISFHYYGDLSGTRRLIDSLKEWNRPLLVTEWLHRPFGNEAAEHLPLFLKEEIGCFHWGLVNGKTQTHEPWDWIADRPLDFSRWQHDLFLPDGTAYDEEEIKLFRRLAGAGASR